MRIVSMITFPGVRVGRIARMRVLLLLVAAGESLTNLLDGVLCGAFGLLDSPPCS
jgi:hypothetical protein